MWRRTFSGIRLKGAWWGGHDSTNGERRLVDVCLRWASFVLIERCAESWTHLVHLTQWHFVWTHGLLPCNFMVYDYRCCHRKMVNNRASPNDCTCSLSHKQQCIILNGDVLHGNYWQLFSGTLCAWHYFPFSLMKSKKILSLRQRTWGEHKMLRQNLMIFCRYWRHNSTFTKTPHDSVRNKEFRVNVYSYDH